MPDPRAASALTKDELLAAAGLATLEHGLAAFMQAPIRPGTPPAIVHPIEAEAAAAHSSLAEAAAAHSSADPSLSTPCRHPSALMVTEVDPNAAALAILGSPCFCVAPAHRVIKESMPVCFAQPIVPSALLAAAAALASQPAQRAAGSMVRPFAPDARFVALDVARSPPAAPAPAASSRAIAMELATLLPCRPVDARRDPRSDPGEASLRGGTGEGVGPPPATPVERRSLAPPSATTLQPDQTGKPSATRRKWSWCSTPLGAQKRPRQEDASSLADDAGKPDATAASDGKSSEPGIEGKKASEGLKKRARAKQQHKQGLHLLFERLRTVLDVPPDVEHSGSQDETLAIACSWLERWRAEEARGARAVRAVPASCPSKVDEP